MSPQIIRLLLAGLEDQVWSVSARVPLGTYVLGIWFSVLHALKGLACHALVTPASSPASHCKQCSALMSPLLHARGCARPSRAPGGCKNTIFFPWVQNFGTPRYGVCWRVYAHTEGVLGWHACRVLRCNMSLRRRLENFASLVKQVCVLCCWTGWVFACSWCIE